MSRKIISILILSFAISFCHVIPSTGSTKVSATRVQIELLSEALLNLKNDVGRYPTEDEGLALLLKPTSGLEGKWHGPYLNKEIPSDPWGNEYIYHCPARYGNMEFDLYSFGVLPPVKDGPTPNHKRRQPGIKRCMVIELLTVTHTFECSVHCEGFKQK